MTAIRKNILSVFRKFLGIILCFVALLTALQFLGVFEKNKSILKYARTSDIEGEVIRKIDEVEQFCRLNGRLPTEFSDTRHIKVEVPQYITDIQQQSFSDFLNEKVFLLTITALNHDDLTRTLDGESAFSLDSIIDDGLPNSGKMRFFGSSACLIQSEKGKATYNKDYRGLNADCTAFTIKINCEKKIK
jgi:hypothetical protein